MSVVTVSAEDAIRLRHVCASANLVTLTSAERSGLSLSEMAVQSLPPVSTIHHPSPVAQL